jgi:hypothetical protein
MAAPRVLVTLIRVIQESRFKVSVVHLAFPICGVSALEGRSALVASMKNDNRSSASRSGQFTHTQENYCDRRLGRARSHWTLITRRWFLAAAAASIWTFALTSCERSNDVPITSSTTNAAPPAGTGSGLDFPGSAAVATTMRFRFLNPLAIYPATYIWRAYPRQQSGYYTAFFWGNDDGQENLNTFLWKSGKADSYYGAHPYPNPPPNGTNHRWEIAILQDDFVNGTVVYNRWYTQALRVWADASGKHHEFYWDLPNADASHRVTWTAPTSYGNTNPPVPALTWGDAPWNPGKEVWDGILRGIQIYSTNLSVSEILTEANSPLSTAAGATNIWYLNLNPTPDDISDKSGHGHDPAWVEGEHPALWTP